MTVGLGEFLEDRVAATRKIVAETDLPLSDPDVVALSEDLFSLYGWMMVNVHHREAKTAAQKREKLLTIHRLARALAAELKRSPDIASLLANQAGSRMVHYAIDRGPELLAALADSLLKTPPAQLERVPRPPMDQWSIGGELPDLYLKYFGRARAKPGDAEGPKNRFIHACLEALGRPKELSTDTIAKHRKRWLKRGH
jgi:hypothetical protein